MKISLYSNQAEALVYTDSKGRKQYWLRLHAVLGFKTEVRICRKMYDTIQMAHDFDKAPKQVCQDPMCPGCDRLGH